MEAIIGAAGLVQLAISGVAFLQHIPEIQSDFSKLCNEISFIRALCEDAVKVVKQNTNPNLRPIEDSLVLQTKVVLEDIHNELVRIKQGCERAGESEAVKRKFIIKEAKISALLSKAQATKADLGLAMGSEAAVDGKESLRLQGQVRVQLGTLERKMEGRFLLMKNEATRNNTEVLDGQNKLSGQLGDVEREMEQHFLGLRHEAISNRNEMIKRQNQIDAQMREFNFRMERLLEMEKVLQRLPQVMGVAIQEGIAINQPTVNLRTLEELVDDRGRGSKDGEGGRSLNLGERQGIIINDRAVEQTTSAFVTVRRARCSYNCRCRCHVKLSHFSSPRWAEQLTGSWEVKFRPPMARSQWERSCPCAGSECMAVEWRPPRWPNIQLLVYGCSFSIWTPRPVRVIPSINREWMYFTKPVEYFQKAYKEGMIVYPDDANEVGVYMLERVINERAFDMLEFLMSQWANMLPKQGLAKRVGNSAHFMVKNLLNGHDAGRRLMQQVLSFVEDYDRQPETTPLHEAAIRGYGVHEAIGEFGIPATEAVDMPDASGLTPLFWATLHGHYNAVQQLIDAGADINGQGVTPLMAAAMNNWIDIIQQLLSAGRRRNKTRCRINQQDQYGRTALHWAAHHSNYRAVQLLLDEGAAASFQDLHGWTPLHYAAVSESLGITSTVDIERTLHVLLKAKNGDIDTRTFLGNTPFSLSLAGNAPIAFHWLKNAGAAPNILSRDSRNILHTVALRSHVSVLTYLCSINLDGISIHLKDSSGNTPWDLFISTLCTPIWGCWSARKPNKAESDAFVLLYRSIRDRNIHQDRERLQNALAALSINDPGAACSFIRELVAVKKNCGEMDLVNFYQGIEKDIQAGLHDTPANAIRDEIEDLQAELATNPWDEPSHSYTLGDPTFKEPDLG